MRQQTHESTLFTKINLRPLKIEGQRLLPPRSHRVRNDAGPGSEPRYRRAQNLRGFLGSRFDPVGGAVASRYGFSKGGPLYDRCRIAGSERSREVIDASTLHHGHRVACGGRTWNGHRNSRPVNSARPCPARVLIGRCHTRKPRPSSGPGWSQSTCIASEGDDAQTCRHAVGRSRRYLSNAVGQLRVGMPAGKLIQGLYDDPAPSVRSSGRSRSYIAMLDARASRSVDVVAKSLRSVRKAAGRHAGPKLHICRTLRNARRGRPAIRVFKEWPYTSKRSTCWGLSARRTARQRIRELEEENRLLKGVPHDPAEYKAMPRSA